MSCFNGQMKEYTRIAIDRFDSKNLKCTAFFLSHCHKDHMVGLNSSSFIDSLNTRDGVFLYCSEITRLLLLAEEDYSHLSKYICVLKVGVSQPVRVPSNIKSVEEYYVNVTPISAGHCPGSVMFLFEGHEGTCLYTGDFRWEINHAAGIDAFKQEKGLKHIKSIYADTTFCIPEAYNIPKRSECVDAAVTLVSDWLQRCALNVVFMSCPARYGYEHLLMELSKRLNVKIHVPEWKAKIYDQIPDLNNAFTSDPNQARIHACSAKVICRSCLPCHSSSEGKQFHVLNLRPSAMWFTSEKSKSRTGDLIVTPVSQRGLYRICYSMHSSYSEIRDLVSYLQPKHVFPNVMPVSDASIETVQIRLNSFKNHFNKARVPPSVMETSFQPLGVLRKIVPVSINIQQLPCKQDAESSDELLFSSQETNPKKEVLESISKSHFSSERTTLQAGAGKLNESSNSKKATSESLSADGISRSSASELDSSYQNSVISDEELKLFSDDGDDEKTEGLMVLQATESSYDKQDNEDSLHIYISDDSETSELICSGDSDVNLKGDYDSAFTEYSVKDRHDTTHDMDGSPERKITVSHSTLDASFIEQQKPSKTDITSSNCATRLAVHEMCSGCEDSTGKCFNEHKVKHIQQKEGKKVRISSAGSETVKSASEYTLNTVSVNNKIGSNLENDVCTNNGCQIQNEDSDDIVFSSQGSTTAPFIQNQISKTIFHQATPSYDQNEKILTSDNECSVKEDIKASASPLPDYTQCSSEETVTVLSSSDDSQTTLEQESQTLWSVSYNLDNFTPSHTSFDTKTDNGMSHNSSCVKATCELSFNEGKGNVSEPLDCLNTVPFKANCAGKQEGGHSLYVKEEKFLCHVLQAPNCKVNKQVKELNNYSLSKRKFTISNISNASNSHDVKKFKNRRTEYEHSVFIDPTAAIKDEFVMSSARVEDSKSSYCSFQEISYSECHTTGSDRHVVKVQSKCPVDNSDVNSKDLVLLLTDLPQCKHGHKSDDCHRQGCEDFREVSAQSLHLSHKSEWVDLTVKTPDSVIDLTLESSQ